MSKKAIPIIRDSLKTYCYHCGKEIIKEQTTKHCRHIHPWCNRERESIIYHSRGARWLKLMADPEIREKIRETDTEIINKLLQEKQKEVSIWQKNTMTMKEMKKI